MSKLKLRKVREHAKGQTTCRQQRSCLNEIRGCSVQFSSVQSLSRVWLFVRCIVALQQRGCALNQILKYHPFVRCKWQSNQSTDQKGTYILDTKSFQNNRLKWDSSEDFKKFQPVHLCTSAVLNTRDFYHHVSTIKPWQPTEQIS